jgi:hypothetical protein
MLLLATVICFLHEHGYEMSGGMAILTLATRRRESMQRRRETTATTSEDDWSVPFRHAENDYLLTLVPLCNCNVHPDPDN